MTPADVATLLESQFGPAVTGKKLDALDPFVTVEPGKLVEIATFLRDDPRLKFELLNNVTGVDYLETDQTRIILLFQRR